MTLTVSDILNLRFKKIEEMSTEEIKEELKMLREVWSRVPYEIRNLCVKIGRMYRFVGRDYRGVYGVFLGFESEVTWIEVGVYEKKYDSVGERYFMERKIVKMRFSNIIKMEEILEREPVIEKEEVEEEIEKIAEEEEEAELKDIEV